MQKKHTNSYWVKKMKLIEYLEINNIPYEKVGNKLLINEDCFNILKILPSRSVDLIFTDPPYDKNEVGLQRLTDEQKRTIAKEFARIIKDEGNIALMCGKICKWKWYNILSELGLKLHSEVTWLYTNPPQFKIPAECQKGFIWSHDTILCFSISDKFYFNVKEIKDRTDWIQTYTLTGIIRGSENLPEYIKGTTPRPLKVANKIIKFMLPKDGIILDPFMGTGTFLIPANKGIGIEKNKEVYKVAVGRVKKYKQKESLEWHMEV